jgi:hypothetical protein
VVASVGGLKPLAGVDSCAALCISASGNQHIRRKRLGRQSGLPCSVAGTVRRAWQAAAVARLDGWERVPLRLCASIMQLQACGVCSCSCCAARSSHVRLLAHHTHIVKQRYGWVGACATAAAPQRNAAADVRIGGRVCSCCAAQSSHPQADLRRQ